MRTWAALDLEWTPPGAPETAELLAASLDDFRPTAIEEGDGRLRAYFSTPEARDRAASGCAGLLSGVTCRAVDVPDEQWAERSQASIGPVAVGRVVVAPPWTEDAALPDGDIVIRVRPSMGFGTGHHASTRLCLALLQRLPLHGRSVLDVGTGSGVLALAAWRLGAARAVGVDCDPDALASAADNLALNAATSGVTLAQADLASTSDLPQAPCDVVLANLTAASLERFAPRLAALTNPSGAIVASGFERADVERVAAAFAACGWSPAERLDDGGWVGVRFAAITSPSSPTGR